MAKDDDRYEYVKGTYKTRRDRLHTNHGRPPVLGVGPFRDDGGHLDSHAEFIPCDEDEYEKQPDREPVYIYVNEMREADARSRERSELEELLGSLMILGVLVSFEKAKPHVKR